MEQLSSNIFKTALLFEGGSMRAAYTSAVAVRLLEEGVYFDTVYGVSAGSSNAVNYLSRDAVRCRVSFTDFMSDPKCGDWKTFLQGKGMFNAHYIYQEVGAPGGSMPLDFETFMANPAKMRVLAIDRDTGDDLLFTKDQVHVVDDVLVRVRASSTLPVLMPPPVVDGRVCYDGGFGEGGGLPLKTILAEGFDRVVVVRTRKRGYRKHDANSWAKTYFWRRPAMRDALLSRSERYNQSCDLLDEMEKDGRAYVFYADDLTLTGSERDVALFKENYNAGYAQIQREWPALMAYLQKAEAPR